ncbi:anhydro-N-acetylmuramic acid kinase [Aliidiomarina sanyensis]|uniref:Anhydro-N-acetylmuramic acid kinase n=1 Tax=Aliidiomarina sanyensis TaxID=1249555 RepID=A0A432WCF7_9GAMM|nr:anhydro-N-acetylmuramic acid kinase [Aliidiomarina sanyensis]RUO30160.1 anhydro-N-acetylmuramic acid kinase [Aliidiomarina sanyensis]
MAAERFIGALSGTSLDGIDLVLTEISAQGEIRQLDAFNASFPEHLRNSLKRLCTPGSDEIIHLGQADRRFAEAVAQGVQTLLERNALDASAIRAIGHHGQTIRHHPELDPGFSLQIGCSHTLAAKTGIDVIGQFRQKDIALGGEGAPLAPVFHHWVFADTCETRIVANIGGIANISVLPPKTSDTPILGYDTGPGNTLLDHWVQHHHQQHYDVGGRWAASGTVHEGLLATLLSDPYFARSAPKSTGREYFTSNWLHQRLERFESIAPADVQATLLELTAQSLTTAIQSHLSDSQMTVYICGGGAHNSELITRCKALLPDVSLQTTDTLGVNVDWVEGTLFAWLAWAYVQGLTLDLTAVTGASRPARLGAYFPKD